MKKYIEPFIFGWVIGYILSRLNFNIFIILVIAFCMGAIWEGVRIWLKYQKKDTGKI